MVLFGVFVFLLAAFIVDAYALPPDHTLALLPVGLGSGGQVERMDISSDGTVVVGRTRDNLQAWLLDVDRWTLLAFSGPSTTDGCSVTGAAVITLTDGTYEIWLSCLEGKLVGKAYDGETVTNVLDTDGVALTFEAVADNLNGVWWHESSELLYAVAAGDAELGTLAEVHVVDPFGIQVDGDVFPGYPKPYSYAEFNEGVILDDSLIVSHSGNNISSLQLGFGATPQPGIFTFQFNCVDLATSPFGWVYCVDPIGQVAQFTPVTNLFQTIVLGVLSEPQAVCVTDNPLDGWIGITGLQVQVWGMTPTGGVPNPVPLFESAEDADSQIEDMVTRDGYIFGGGVAGNLHIVSARPWIKQGDLLSVVPDSGGTGDVVTLTFQVDQHADWEVFLGGDRFGFGGDLLGSGTTNALTNVSLDITLQDTWVEGDNPVYIIATNDLGVTGHGRVDVNVDNPPGPPTLTASALAFADGALVLSFDGIDDEDLDHYTVYVSQTPFTSADWPLGGPEFDGTTSLATPVTVVSTPGATVTHRIQPLENYVTYYIGVHAWDAGGKEGPMSQVVSGTPLPTFSAAELAGETGGNPCENGGGSCATGGSVPAIGVLPVFVWLLRRSRRVGAAAALAVVVGLAVLPSSAYAQSSQKPFWDRKDLTRANGDFEMKYGTIILEDEAIKTVYGNKPTNLLQIEAGPQLWRILEFDMQFGFFQELAHTVSPTGEPSGEVTMLTWWPLGIDATFRAHIVDEQPLVPFIRYGWDYVWYSDKTDNGSGGKDVIRGSKFGQHWAVGGNLLLDMIEPRRASALEAQSGINDSWITVEYRRQAVDNRPTPWGKPNNDPQLVLSGNALLIGLKIDY